MLDDNAGLGTEKGEKPHHKEYEDHAESSQTVF